MKFVEVANRLNGFSFSMPAFGGGLSWEPSELAVTMARRVIRYLENRRVLFAPDALELPQHCVASVLAIRNYLTEELTESRDDHSEILVSMRAMRAACRKFIDVAGNPGVVENASYQGHWANWVFYPAVGEMRGVFGIQLALLAAKFHLDIEDDLAAIIPAKDDAL